MNKILTWIVVGVVLTIIILLFYFCNFGVNGISSKTDDWNNFGGYLSGTLGVLFNLVSAILIYYTFKRQESNSIISQFETTFFNLIQNHREVVKSLKDEFTIILNEEDIKDRESTFYPVDGTNEFNVIFHYDDNNKSERPKTEKRLLEEYFFLDKVKEEIENSISDKIKSDIYIKTLNENEKVVQDNDINPDKHNLSDIRYQQFYKFLGKNLKWSSFVFVYKNETNYEYKNNGIWEKRVLNVEEVNHIAKYCFMAKMQDKPVLYNFFNNLIYTIVYIDESDILKKQKEKYFGILKSQLRSSELFLLYFYCLYDEHGSNFIKTLDNHQILDSLKKLPKYLDDLKKVAYPETKFRY